MACPEDLKPINTDTDDIKMETAEIPISIKAEPGGLDGYVQNQTSDRIDTISSDGAGPSSYQLKSEEVDLGELKLEVDEDSSEPSKEEDSRRSEQCSSSKNHRCTSCEYKKSDLTSHMRKHRKNSGITFDCAKCRKKFSSKISTDDHIVKMHGQDAKMMETVTRKIYHCNHCEYVTIIKRNLTRHLRTHGEKFGVTFDCTKCRKEFSSQISIDDHIERTHSHDVKMLETLSKTIYRCDYCKYVTVVKSFLIKHMRTHVIKHGVIFDCIKCEKGYSSKTYLNNHIVRMHCDDVQMMKSITCKIYRCHHCEYVTVVKSNLICHMGMHRGNLRVTFDCTKCGKGYSRKKSLDDHIVKMHSDDEKLMETITRKIYDCHHCKYVTVVRCKLTGHMRMHGEKFRMTFDCTKCRKEFAGKTSLDDHIVRTHNHDVNMMKSITKKIYHCNHCEYITIIKRNLTRHMRTHNGKV